MLDYELGLLSLWILQLLFSGRLRWLCLLGVAAEEGGGATYWRKTDSHVGDHGGRGGFGYYSGKAGGLSTWSQGSSKSEAAAGGGGGGVPNGSSLSKTKLGGSSVDLLAGSLLKKLGVFGWGGRADSDHFCHKIGLGGAPGGNFWAYSVSVLDSLSQYFRGTFYDEGFAGNVFVRAWNYALYAGGVSGTPGYTRFDEDGYGETPGAGKPPVFQVFGPLRLEKGDVMVAGLALGSEGGEGGYAYAGGGSNQGGWGGAGVPSRVALVRVIGFGVSFSLAKLSW
jgi:hypothetical protein